MLSLPSLPAVHADVHEHLGDACGLRFELHCPILLLLLLLATVLAR